MHRSPGIRTLRLASTFLALVAFAGTSTADPKREVPDYDGRGNQDADAGSWALWIPRVVLSPFYVANEYVLRRPLGAVVRRAERGRWVDSVVQLFTFGEGGRNLLVPTALFDFGLLPSVGFYYAAEGMFAPGNAIRIHGATWGKRWINATAADRYTFNQRDSVQLRFEFKRSADNLFLGIGPDVTDDTRARYGLERFEGSAGFRRRMTKASRFEAELGAHRISFFTGDCCHDPSIDTRLANGEMAMPPGYRDAYTAMFARAAVTLDSRRPRPDPGSGIYLHAYTQSSVDTSAGGTWLAYGGVAGGAIDLTGHRRTLRAQVSADLVDDLTGDDVPFTEYATLGGELMPGFVPGWLTGRSTATAQLAYTWPVWLGLDAQTRFTIGNAFGERLAGLAPGKLRMSGDLGFTTSTARDQGFEILVGIGSETFDQGAQITSVRVTVGSRRGF